MVAVDSVEAYLAGRDPGAVAFFRKFEELVEACGPVVPAPSKTVVYWKRNRVFAGAHVNGGRLELVIDLLREAEHPLRLAAFNTTKRVITLRLRITDADELDESIAALLQEAYDDVGPGARGG